MSKSFGFRKAWSGPVLSSQEATRQGEAVRAAKDALGDSESVRTFLNTHHAGLRGRPLDLAVATEAGLIAVKAAICIEGRRGLQSC